MRDNQYRLYPFPLNRLTSVISFSGDYKNRMCYGRVYTLNNELQTTKI